MTASKGKIRIYRGLPGSGKTSRAEDYIFINGGRLVGRDHIRPMVGVDPLINPVGTPEQENEVTEIQERLIVNGVRAGQSVHVDDMNLRSKYVKRLIGLADYLETEFEIVDLTDQPLAACIRFDEGRGRRGGRWVGPRVITDLYNRFVKNQPYPLPVPTSDKQDLKLLIPEPYVPDSELEKAVLIDIDGTVALHEGIRGHHDYDKVSLDQPNPPVIAAVQALIGRGLIPIFVTGRPDSCRFDTTMWISKHVYAGPFILLSRKTGDRRPDFVVKLEIFNNLVRHKFNVQLAIDDRDQVVRMYRELGLTVMQVAPGNF